MNSGKADVGIALSMVRSPAGGRALRHRAASRRRDDRISDIRKAASDVRALVLTRIVIVRTAVNSTPSGDEDQHSGSAVYKSSNSDGLIAYSSDPSGLFETR